MISITCLLENTLGNPQIEKQSDKKTSLKLQCANGLSLFIKFDGKKILFDTGPNAYFYKNAKKLNIKLSDVDVLLFSHAHKDHTGGVNCFCKINDSAEIFMEHNIGKYYSMHGNYMKFIGFKASNRYLNRINMLSNPCQITKNSWLIPCTVNHYGIPKRNSNLLKKDGNKFQNDDFSHEGIFVLDDNGELVVFNSCSHRGVINSIESARNFFPNKKVRSYVGGFHFPYKNGQNIAPEDMRNLEELIDYVNLQKTLTLYTGHCTGNATFDYLQNALGTNRLVHLRTGLTFSV